MTTKRLLIFDLYALFHRSFHAIRTSLSTPDGTVCRGTYGATNAVLAAIKKYEPSHVIFCTEGGSSCAKRREIDPDYKSNRGCKNDDFYQDLRLFTNEVCGTFKWLVWSVFGLEGDDSIACIRGRFEDDFDEFIIYTCDSDMFQLIDPQTTVVQFTSAKKITEWTEKQFVEKYKFLPEWYPDYKAVVGDKSDNIEGIKGYGPKKTTTLIENAGMIGLRLPTTEMQKQYEKNLSLIELTTDACGIIPDNLLALMELQPLDTEVFQKNIVENLGFRSYEKRLATLQKLLGK